MQTLKSKNLKFTKLTKYQRCFFKMYAIIYKDFQINTKSNKFLQKSLIANSIAY